LLLSALQADPEADIIDSGGRRAAGAGAQQQMRVASCREPMKEAQRSTVVLFGVVVSADAGEQAGRGADEVYAALHPLHQAERDQTRSRLRRQPVYTCSQFH